MECGEMLAQSVTWSSGTATNCRDMRSCDQNSGSSTVRRARSQMMPWHSTLARHFLGLPGRRTCTVVAFMICMKIIRKSNTVSSIATTKILPKYLKTFYPAKRKMQGGPVKRRTTWAFVMMVFLVVSVTKADPLLVL